MVERMTVDRALEALSATTEPYVELLAHGTLSVEFYKPDRQDRQIPHSQDEVYVVAAGSGEFVNGDQRHPVEAGEVLFVPAGVEHRFLNFSEDFAAWVIFYGPEGGEGEEGVV